MTRISTNGDGFVRRPENRQHGATAAGAKLIQIFDVRRFLSERRTDNLLRPIARRVIAVSVALRGGLRRHAAQHGIEQLARGIVGKAKFRCFVRKE